MSALLEGVKSDAVLSPDEVYRYALTRDWFPKSAGHVLWIMLNPSTADAAEDDPTVRRCQSFARSWGYDGITVVNLFALRSTDPAALKTATDPIGPANDDVIGGYLEAKGIGIAVAAWGVHGRLRYRDQAVIALAARAGRTLHMLGQTKEGKPKHPLYVPAKTLPMIYREGTAVPRDEFYDKGFVSLNDRFLTPRTVSEVAINVGGDVGE